MREVERGLVLLAVDAVLFGLPRMAMGFYSFAVLSSIGAGLLLLAAIRDWPTRVLLPVALAILVLHPLLDVSGLPVALRALLYEPVRSGALRSLYPVLPWFGSMLLGYVVGRGATTGDPPVRRWLAYGGISLAVFVVVRVANGYGNAYPYANASGMDFWLFAKYPPDLPFLSWALAAVFASLAALASVCRNGVPAILRPLETYGRVPFFFYIVHFFALGAVAAVAKVKLDVPGVLAVWVALLLAMWWPCTWYARLKRARPDGLTRLI